MLTIQTMSPRKSAKGKNTKAQTKGPKVEKPMNGGKPWTHEHVQGRSTLLGGNANRAMQVALLCEERGKEPSSSHGKIGIILGRTPQSCRLKYMHMNDAEKAAVKSKPSRVANRTQVDPGSQTIGYDNLQNTGSDAATALPASSSAVHQTVEIAPSSAQEPGYVLEQAGGDAATALPASSSSVHQAVEKGLSSSPESEHVLEEAGLSTNVSVHLQFHHPQLRL